MDLASLESTEESIPSIISITEMSLEEAQASLQSSPDHNGTALKRIKTSHHALAKLLAAGFKDPDIARKTGYAVGTVNTLKSNPTIKELVEHYSGEFQETVGELHDRMEALTIDLMDELQTRLDSDDTRKDISMGELQGLLKDLLDRTGRGPIRRIEQHTVSENLHGGIIKHVREVASEKRFDSRGGNGGERPVLQMPEDRRLGMGEVPVEESLGQGTEEIRVDSSGSDV